MKAYSWTPFSWDFKNGEVKSLPDNDIIKLEVKCSDDIPSDKVRFSLVESGTWWKSITKFAGTHFVEELVAVQDTPGTKKSSEVHVDDLDLYNFVFSKAKTFGIHTDMYLIANPTDMQPGCDHFFKWTQD